MSEENNDAPEAKKKVEHVFRAKIENITQENKDKLERELTFRVSFVTSSGSPREGVFVAVRQYNGSFIRYRVAEAKLNGGVDPGVEARWLNNRIAYLQEHLTDLPKWWSPLEPAWDENDNDVIEDVYVHVTRWVNSFRRPSVA